MLKVHLNTALHKNIAGINLVDVSTQLDSILQTIVTWSNDRGRYGLVGVACHMLSQCLPLLAQYSSLVQYLLTVSVASHRATTKLLSVLLAIFSELAQKVRIFTTFMVKVHNKTSCIGPMAHDN